MARPSEQSGERFDTAVVERLAWLTIGVCLVAMSLAVWATRASILLMQTGGGQ